MDFLYLSGFANSVECNYSFLSIWGQSKGRANTDVLPHSSFFIHDVLLFVSLIKTCF